MKSRALACVSAFLFLFPALVAGFALAAPESSCVQCHETVSPGQVADWRVSRHHTEGIDCADCHGTAHTSAKDPRLAVLPDENLCAQCHEEQFEQFIKGKHNLGWASMNALPVTHLEPDELIEGGRGCGGCHNMGVKSKEEKERMTGLGYRYQNNSCDECHTRHAFSKTEALNPRACQQCHMGFDHPQWEMWSSSKHGARYLIREAGDLPQEANAPSCQHCHMPGGTHENHTAWGFLGVRLPLPEDAQWKQDRITLLKALGVLHPETGEPTALLDVVRSLDLARLTEEAWQTERERMITTCAGCHAESYARHQLEMGDAIIQKADRLMAQAIETVAALYRDGLIQKPEAYPYNYPNLLFFMRTGGGDLAGLSYIDQLLLKMYLKHRMRTYQAFFHVNPDYAYWYGWAAMVEELGAIQAKARQMRAQGKKDRPAP